MTVASTWCAEADKVFAAQVLTHTCEESRVVEKPATELRYHGVSVPVWANTERISPRTWTPNVHGIGRDLVSVLVEDSRHRDS
jgi:hypothetical protein